MVWIRESNKTHQRVVTAHVVGSRRVQSLVPSDRRTLETCASGLMQIREKGYGSYSNKNPEIQRQPCAAEDMRQQTRLKIKSQRSHVHSVRRSQKN